MTQFKLFGDPEYVVKREKFCYGQPGADRWEQWYCIYKNGIRTLKFLQLKTALDYVRFMSTAHTDTPRQV